MKIRQVEAIPFAIPYTKPLRFASGEVSVASHVLVRVHTDDGIVGTAEAPPRPFTYGETQASIIAVINDLFTPGIVGRDLLEREPIRAHLHRTVGNPTAKAAVDMAIWDALGQTLDVSVKKLLGGWDGFTAGQSHARVRVPRGHGGTGTADARVAWHHDVQGQGGPTARGTGRRGVPSPA